MKKCHSYKTETVTVERLAGPIPKDIDGLSISTNANHKKGFIGGM
jgi:hypothetical protein